MPYADLATLKLSLNIDPADTTRDVLLNQALDSATAGIDRMTGRTFTLDAIASLRVFNPNDRVVVDGCGEILLADDIGIGTLTVETGTADGGSWTAVTDYEPVPLNALSRGRPLTGLRRISGTWGRGISRVRITARWGWPSVPDEVVQATLIQASRLYKRKDSPEGIVGSADWGVVRVSRIDPDVGALILHFVLPGFG